MIAFIDTEVNPQTKKVADYGAVKAWTDKGYEVTSAKVSYTLAWKPQDSNVEYAVCLANTVLSKVGEKNESIT